MDVYIIYIQTEIVYSYNYIKDEWIEHLLIYQKKLLHLSNT